MRDPDRLGTSCAFPVVASEGELRCLASTQLGLDPAHAAVVQVAVHLVGQLRPGGIDDDGVVEAS